MGISSRMSNAAKSFDILAITLASYIIIFMVLGNHFQICIYI